MIVLVVATAGSITALFLRGFQIKDFAEQLKAKNLDTPTLEVWLLETPGYHDKMDAYQAGLAASSNGLGVYVLPVQEQWTWVACAYKTKDDADNALKQINLSTTTKVEHYQITGKKIQISPDVFVPCQQILTSVKNVFNLLFDLRDAISNSTNIKDIQLQLTTEYNQIKSGVEVLQKLNATLHNQLIATVIYTANQNILSLQDIIFDTPNLATVNTALLKTIFSLDNF